jgi:hypothetical protein
MNSHSFVLLVPFVGWDRAHRDRTRRKGIDEEVQEVQQECRMR